MSMTSEREKWMNFKNGTDSSSVEYIISSGANGPLKKGPWTSAEDAILVEYVTKHGEGNWNAVQKHSGVARCGKSCRLRWANHLRPDLKKGAFSPEEEHHIIELHAKMGNKWARMAAELPGRTDNEIKNYWNTRIKRRQRAGLPIYPPDICLQATNENEQNEKMTAFSSGDAHHPDYLPINHFEFPHVEFKTMELGQLRYPTTFLDLPPDSLLDVPANSILSQGPDSSYPEKYFLSTIYPSKKCRRSETLFPGLNTTVGNTAPDENHYQSDGSMQISQSFVFLSALDHNSYDHNSTPDHASSSSALPGTCAILNSNTSSEPTWAMKLELPSLQTLTASWGSPSSPLPSLESVDTLIQTLPNENDHSGNLSPQDNGLLDAVLYESHSMKNSRNNSFHQTSNASFMPVDMMDTSSHDVHETEWEAIAEPISPLCHSSSSMFSDISRNSFDDLHSSETMPVKGEAADDLVLMKLQNMGRVKNQMVFSTPDFLLASDFFAPKKDQSNNHYLLKDALGTLFCDDLSKDRKQMDMPDSCSWNAMPTV